MKPNSTARIQTTPWHSGKTVRMITLDERGRPSRSDWAFAQKKQLHDHSSRADLWWCALVCWRWKMGITKRKENAH